MKICPNCDYQNREGYMFCEDCGEELSAVVSIPSKELVVISTAAAFALHIADVTEPVMLRPDVQTTLGRLDEERAHLPDIDLTPYGAYESGVSAIHAMIEHDEDGVQIMDMDSTNGTYVNDRRLPPNQAYILHTGDVIRFGRLEARIQF